MDNKSLEEKWKTLTADSSGYKSLRIDGACVPDLFIGVSNATTRSLILKLPAGNDIDFQSTVKANLSIRFFPETNWIVIDLLDVRFTDLFNDLILSIYNKIAEKNKVAEYSSELITTFYKWSEFFHDKDSLQLSEETIRGIFGELIVLREHITEAPASSLNDLLAAWRGPYHHRHDFAFLQTDVEVKAKEEAAISIQISSEFQLDEDSGKPLELAVVSLRRESAGISLRELVLGIRELIISRLADFTLVLRALTSHGLSIRALQEYDSYRYTPASIEIYDCSAAGFPRITPADLPESINEVGYALRTTALTTFLKTSKKL